MDLAELKQALRSELPEHMVPAHFAWVDGFALTPSGKRDDAALRALPLEHGSNIEYLAPRDDYERTLAGLLGELLDRPRVGIRDSFFDLGGTSLSAMRFMLLIEKRYGVDLPMAALIETPTVEGLAERLRERSAVRAFDPLVPIRAGGSRPPLFLVHPLGGHVLCYLPLVRALPPDHRYMPCRRPAPARAVRRWRSSRTSPPVTSRRSAGCSRKAPITSAAGRSAASSPTRWPGNCARSTRRRSPN